jgi:hypothetical protein
MLAWLRRRLTYGNVLLTLCFLLLLGGGAYAVTGFVGSDGKIHACVTSKGAVTLVKAGTKCTNGQKAIAWNQLGPRGPRGLRGLRGFTGPPGPVPATLPSGKTLRGAWVLGHQGGAGDEIDTAISFPFPLASSPAVHVIQKNAAVPPGCSGTGAAPGADPGNLCVFVRFASNLDTASGVDFYGVDGVGHSGTPDTRFGVAIYGFSNAAGTMETTGTWAVTAP